MAQNEVAFVMLDIQMSKKDHQIPPLHASLKRFRSYLFTMKQLRPFDLHLQHFYLISKHWLPIIAPCAPVLQGFWNDPVKRRARKSHVLSTTPVFCLCHLPWEKFLSSRKQFWTQKCFTLSRKDPFLVSCRFNSRHIVPSLVWWTIVIAVWLTHCSNVSHTRRTMLVNLLRIQKTLTNKFSGSCRIFFLHFLFAFAEECYLKEFLESQSCLISQRF